MSDRCPLCYLFNHPLCRFMGCRFTFYRPALYWIPPVRHFLCYSLSHSGIIRFSFNILRTNRRNETKFCLAIIIDKIYYVGIIKRHFRKFSTELRPLVAVFAPYLENEWTKFNQILYTHLSIDKIYVGIVKRHFSQFCNRVTALD